MGISVLVSGEEVSFKGTLSVVPGDNLASQYLGGYKSLASAHRKCRNCFAVKEDMQTKVRNNYIVIKNIHTNLVFFS